MWGKSTHYDDAAGVPMIVAGPDVARGRVCRTPVSLVDLAPTIMAGRRRGPARLGEGPARAVAVRDRQTRPTMPTRTVFSEYHAFGSPSAAFMLRNGRYKYNYYVGYPPELFDLDCRSRRGAQPAPPTPDYAAVVAGFEAQLRAMLDPEATDARAKADQAALIARFGGPEKAQNVGAPGATPAPV